MRKKLYLRIRYHLLSTEAKNMIDTLTERVIGAAVGKSGTEKAGQYTIF